MAAFDFDKFQRPAGRPKHLDPIEIFRSLPNLPRTPNDLWQGQSEALQAWHKLRTEPDVLILQNTGAGKSIVGALDRSESN